MEEQTQSSYPKVEVIPLDAYTADIIPSMSRESYPAHITMWQEDDILDPYHIPRGILDLSFLIKDEANNYHGYCVALLMESAVDATIDDPVLYIADMAVLPASQRSYHGLTLCREVLKRANQFAVDRIEFHAREETSYRAIMSSAYTKPILAEFGYELTEHDDTHAIKLLSDEGNVLETGRLISLKRITDTVDV